MRSRSRRRRTGQVRRTSRGPACTVARVETREVVTLYVTCAPDGPRGGGQRQDEGAPAPDLADQARSMYQNLQRALAQEGASQGVVLSQRVFLADIDRGFPTVDRVHRELYGGPESAAPVAPAASFIQQPPCDRHQLCALQAQVLVPRAHVPIRIGGGTTRSTYATTRILEVGDARHIAIAHVVPAQDGGAAPDTPTTQAQAVFRHAREALHRSGATWRDVVRTWIWLAHIERDYETLNAVRNGFYETLDLGRLPASTGIGGVPYPTDSLYAMDLYAYQSRIPVTIEAMKASTMNEAPEYGSAFARGLRVSRPDQTVLLISGTASIDTRGRVVHAGDVKRQVQRTCENIEGLLAAHEATVDDLVSLISYLKSADSLATFRRVLCERSWPDDVPNVTVQADVCRPDWLVEVEAVAVVQGRVGDSLRPASGWRCARAGQRGVVHT